LYPHETRKTEAKGKRVITSCAGGKSRRKKWGLKEGWYTSVEIVEQGSNEKTKRRARRFNIKMMRISVLHRTESKRERHGYRHLI